MLKKNWVLKTLWNSQKRTAYRSHYLEKVTLDDQSRNSVAARCTQTKRRFRNYDRSIEMMIERTRKMTAAMSQE